MKRNCLYTVNPWNTNIFACGGNKHAFGDFLKEDSNSYMGNWLGANNMSKGAGAMVGALGTAVGGLGSKLIGGGYDAAGVGNGITTIGSTIGGAVSQVNPLVGGIISAGSGIIGGTVNRLWGMKTDQEALNRANSDIASMKSFTSNANSFDNIEGPAAVASIGNVYKGGVFKKGTARRKNQALQNNLNNAVAFANNSVANNIENLQADQFNNLLANYAAFGGYFDMPQATGALGIMRDDKYIGAINNRSNAIAKANAFSQAPTSFSPLGNAFADGGGIHIKPSHKGLFTEKANRAGMGVQAYASHVLANKEDYPSSTVKQANFARNSKSWGKHDAGGSLEAAFLDNFSSDPLGAVMQYNRGLETMAAQREAEAAAVAQQAAYDDMQKRMIDAETERQSLQSMLDSQGLTIQALMEQQRQNNYADGWKERMGDAVDNTVTSTSSLVGNAADKNKNWQYIKKRLKASGKFNDTQIEGIKLNLQRESGFNWKDRSGDSGKAWGLAQWHEPRRPKDMSFDGQINHLIDTLYNYDGKNHWIGKDNYNGFMNARTPEEAHYFIAKGWERPASEILTGLKDASDRSLRKHAFGGELGTNGTDFTTGLLEINTGNSHEENPHEGVQLGFDEQGIPNLVEEGETVYNDYVFSNRLKVPAFMRRQLGLGGSMKDEITFAAASKKIAEAGKERPNNPMDMDYMDDALGKLAQVQEAERMRMQAKEANAEMEAMNEMNMAACGGKLNKYPDGGWKEGIQSLFNVDPRYAASRTEGFIPYNRALTEEQVLAEENNPFFKEWTDYVNNNWDSQEVQDYLRALDAAAGGNHLFDAKGNLLDGAKDYFNKARTQNHLWGYYHLTPNIRHAIKGDDDYLDGNPSTWNNVGAVEGRPEFLPNGNVIFYHGAINGNGVDASNMPYGYDANGAIPWAGLEGVATPTTSLSPMEQIAADKARQLGTEVKVTDDGTNFSVTPKAPATVDRNGVVDRDVYERGTSAESNDIKPYPTWMRYAPAFGAGIMTLTDALGLTNRPDYTYANKLEAAAERLGYAPNVKFNPIGDYMTYRPLDRLFYANQLQANARATDRALANTSGGNRGTAQAAMLANGYNTNNNLGNLYRQAEEYNLAQREKVADFNRRTNMFNSQMALEADSANARYRQMASHASLQGLAQAAAMRDSIDQRVGAARSANLTNLLNSLGNIGRENFALNQINWDRSNKYGARANGTSYYKKPSAHGGKINKRK